MNTLLDRPAFQTAFRLLDEGAVDRAGFHSPVAALTAPREIDALAATFSAEYRFRLCDDIAALVQAAGGQWRFVAGAEVSLQVEGPDRFMISVPKGAPVADVRFAIAEQLGHYVLHSNQGAKPLRAGSADPADADREAARFAQALLMPERSFRALAGRGWSDEQLAAHFKVSAEEVEGRRRSLRAFRRAA